MRKNFRSDNYYFGLLVICFCLFANAIATPEVISFRDKVLKSTAWYNGAKIYAMMESF